MTNELKRWAKSSSKDEYRKKLQGDAVEAERLAHVAGRNLEFTGNSIGQSELPRSHTVRAGKAYSEAAALHEEAGHAARAVVLYKQAAEHFSEAFAQTRDEKGPKSEVAEHRASASAAKDNARRLANGTERVDVSRAQESVDRRYAKASPDHPSAVSEQANWASSQLEHFTKDSDAYSRSQKQDAHAKAGEMHLRAAAVTEGKTKEEHLEKAAAHAEAAGGEWKEEDHPRDTDGKFA